MTVRPPNILLILADNLGWGELGCYGGGVLRGAPTPRIDALAEEGLTCLNFNVESDCVPTRSALMTGRHPIRTGAMQSVPAGLPQGLIPWEITIGELLQGAGYATGCFGKWHLGDREGRLPKDRGFDEWYGIPRTSNEAMFTSAPGFDPTIVPMPYVMEGVKGAPARDLAVYDLEQRRLIDGELTRRTIDFMERQSGAGRPFFAYVPLTQLHFPTLPHHDFAGRTGAGDFADAMAEMDHRVGEMLDAIDRLGLREDTLVLFGSDNGPEFRRPWRGTAGPWRGTYHTAMEGGLRVPFILRWPGRIAPRRTTEVLHITDLYPTLAKVGGARLPADRPIDGIDQLGFFLGDRPTSARDGFPYYIKTELRAVKWRDWKMHLMWEVEPNEGPIKLETPYLFNLVKDPKEETDTNMDEGWVRGPIRRLIESFQESLKAHPPIPPGAPDAFVPGGKAGA
ncbi:arylsulfatase [Reyranella sp.]|uniref:arylsulfatase n=1 Tax=Reyranella sp. TaxID=1929291 RepID=UPI002725A13B|nr:arylsulfatase [Reyranella sp.]MDO8974789.1 arylsulfatase [Reyranella sp.]